jgi:hypothetical protein
VALVVADQNNPYNMVTVRGKVVEQITGPVAENHIDKIAKKYMDKKRTLIELQENTAYCL